VGSWRNLLISLNSIQYDLKHNRTSCCNDHLIRKCFKHTNSFSERNIANCCHNLVLKRILLFWAAWLKVIEYLKWVLRDEFLSLKWRFERRNFYYSSKSIDVAFWLLTRTKDLNFTTNISLQVHKSSNFILLNLEIVKF